MFDPHCEEDIESRLNKTPLLSPQVQRDIDRRFDRTDPGGESNHASLVRRKVRFRHNGQGIMEAEAVVKSYNDVMHSYSVKCTKSGGNVELLDVDVVDAEEAVPLSILQYMCNNRKVMSKWYEAAKIMSVCQVSTYAAERVFSLLELRFPKMGNRGS